MSGRWSCIVGFWVVMGKAAEHNSPDMDVKPVLVAVGMAILWIVAGLSSIDDRQPVSDEIVYLGYAYSIHQFGTFGYARSEDHPPRVSGDIAPGYPAFVAALMHLDETLVGQVQCYITGGDCQGADLYLIKACQVACFGLLAAVIWYLIFVLFGSYRLSILSGILIVLTGVPQYFANHILTEILYLPIAFVAILLLAIGIHAKRPGRVISAYALFAICALIRPSFYYMALLLLPLLVIILYRDRNFGIRESLGTAILAALVFLIVVSPWAYRNYSQFDKASITTGYGARAFTTRLAYNEMDDREFLIGWIYYLPDFGDSLAKRLFPEEDYRRLIEAHPDSLYQRERKRISDQLHEETSARLASYHGDANNTALSWLIENKLMNNIGDHARTTLLLAWRGVFVDKYFGLIGLISLVYLFFSAAFREYRARLLYLSLPCFILLFFQAAVTLNITRYNIVFLLPMSMALSLVLGRFLLYARSWYQ